MAQPAAMAPSGRAYKPPGEFMPGWTDGGAPDSGRGGPAAPRRGAGGGLARPREDLLALAGARAVSGSVTAPLERIKLLLQTHPAAPSGRPATAFGYVASREGLLSGWRGNLANVARLVPQTFVTFGLWDALHRDTGPRGPRQDRSPLADAAAGGLTGVAALALLHPLDVVRTRLAADVGTGRGGRGRRYAGFGDCVRSVTRGAGGGGLRGLYRGAGLALPGVFIYRSLFFSYDAFKEAAFVDESEAHLVGRWGVAQGTTALASLASHPIDTLCRQQMTRAPGQSSWGTVAAFCRAHGVRGLYKGLSANALRSTGGAMALVMYDVCRGRL